MANIVLLSKYLVPTGTVSLYPSVAFKERFQKATEKIGQQVKQAVSEAIEENSGSETAVRDRSQKKKSLDTKYDRVRHTREPIGYRIEGNKFIGPRGLSLTKLSQIYNVIPTMEPGDVFATIPTNYRMMAYITVGLERGAGTPGGSRS